MKSNVRLLANILLISAIVNLATGCSKINKTSGNEYTSIAEEHQEITATYIEAENIKIDAIPNLSSEEVVAESVVVPDDIATNKNIEELLKEYLYDENIDYELVIKTYLNNYDKRIELKNDYLRAIYMLMINSNVSMETYLQELHTMTVMQQIPSCVSEDVWNESFKNLIALDPNCISLFDMFSEFAIYVHGLICEEEHVLNDFYCYSCPDLEEEYTRKLLSKEL